MTLTAAAKKFRAKRVRRPIYATCMRLADPATGEQMGSSVPLHYIDLPLAKERGYKVGHEYRLEIKESRNAAFHRLAHAVGNLLVDNVEAFRDLDAHAALKRVQLEAGICCEMVEMDASPVIAAVLDACETLLGAGARKVLAGVLPEIHTIPGQGHPVAGVRFDGRGGLWRLLQGHHRLDRRALRPGDAGRSALGVLVDGQRPAAGEGGVTHCNLAWLDGSGPVGEPLLDLVLRAAEPDQRIPHEVVELPLVTDQYSELFAGGENSTGESWNLNVRQEFVRPANVVDSALNTLGCAGKFMQSTNLGVDTFGNLKSIRGSGAEEAGILTVIFDVGVWMLTIPDRIVEFYKMLDVRQQLEAQASRPIKHFPSPSPSSKPVLNCRYGNSYQDGGDAAHCLHPSGLRFWLESTPTNPFAHHSTSSLSLVRMMGGAASLRKGLFRRNA